MYDENETMKQLTELLDDGKMALAASQKIEDTDFSNLTPELWEEIQLTNRMFLAKAASFMIHSARAAAAISDDPMVQAGFSQENIDKLVELGLATPPKEDGK